MKKIRVVIAALISISLVVGFYYYLSHSAGEKTIEEPKVLTELESVLAKDLNKDYPKTPREVIKFYNRILLCLYNEEYTDAEFEELADLERGLMDQELLDENPRDQFIQNLKSEVETYRLAGKQIATATVCSSTDVVFKTIRGSECAYVSSSYFTKASSAEYSRAVQQYVLRKDDNEDWRIMGFYLEDGENDNE